MALREGSQGLSTKGKTELCSQRVVGGVGMGQGSGLPPGFGVSVGLGSTDFLLCLAPGDFVILNRCSPSEPHSSS